VRVRPLRPHGRREPLRLDALPVGRHLPWSGHRGPWLAAGLLALAVVGSAIAFALSGDGHTRRGGKPEAPRSLPGPAFALRLPPGWSVEPRPPALPGMRSAALIGLANQDRSVRVVASRLPATSRTLLPAEFVRGMHGTASPPDTVRIGAGLPAWHYTGLTHPAVNGLLDVYLVPTTRGVVTVACLADAASSLLADCWHAVSGLTLRGSQAVAPGPEAAFRAAVLPTIEQVESTRETAQRTLDRVATAGEQADAVAPLAPAFRDAAAKLAVLTARELPASLALPRALRQTAASWAALERRLRLPDLAGFAGARTRLDAREMRLKRLLKQILVRGGN
jgi:hypothetical protein